MTSGATCADPLSQTLLRCRELGRAKLWDSRKLPSSIARSAVDPDLLTLIGASPMTSTCPKHVQESVDQVEGKHVLRLETQNPNANRLGPRGSAFVSSMDENNSAISTTNDRVGVIKPEAE